MEHLVILPERVVRRLFRQRIPRLTWFRRRREPPVGVVRARDRLFLKVPGGDVVASASVTRVTEEFHGGRYAIRIRLRKPERFSIPFPVVKRDRRSWVVCAGDRDTPQQPLFAPPGLTLESLTSAVRRHQKILPSQREIERSLRSLLSQKIDPSRDVGVLLILGILLALKKDVPFPDTLRHLLRRAPQRVYPLAVFSKRN
jgi:hypothetical protein